MERTLEMGAVPLKLTDLYLGFGIWIDGFSYLATPLGWGHETLTAGNLPEIRKRIWRFWYDVESTGRRNGRGPAENIL